MDATKTEVLPKKAEEMTEMELARLVRDVSKWIAMGKEATARAQARRLTDVGLYAGMHQQRFQQDPKAFGLKEIMEFYAGQLILAAEDGLLEPLERMVHLADRYLPTEAEMAQFESQMRSQEYAELGA